MTTERRLYLKKWRKTNRKRLRGYDCEWRKNNPEKVKEYRKKYYDKHKVNILEREAIRREKPEYKEKRRLDGNFYREKYKDKIKCRQILNKAIIKGKFTRATICSLCGDEGNIEAHHDDYTKPFEFIWVCDCCHEVIEHRPEQLRKEQRKKGGLG